MVFPLFGIPRYLPFWPCVVIIGYAFVCSCLSLDHVTTRAHKPSCEVMCGCTRYCVTVLPLRIRCALNSHWERLVSSVERDLWKKLHLTLEPHKTLKYTHFELSIETSSTFFLLKTTQSCWCDPRCVIARAISGTVISCECVSIADAEYLRILHKWLSGKFLGWSFGAIFL